MLKLTNTTPFVADYAIFADANGVDTLYVMVKGTFECDGKLSLAAKQQPLVKADEYLDDPANSSLLSASDFHIGKNRSDIIVTGNAVASGLEPVQEMDVRVKVAGLGKSLRIFGDRNWQAGVMTAPVPFTTMPIIYERAFGADGAIWSQEEYEPANKNPAGVGFVATGHAPDNIPLPNIEDPEALIESPNDCPSPVGLGIVAPHWKPRRYLAGTYDDTWQTHRAPYLPEDFSPDYFNCASTGLVYDGFLKGGEPIWVDGMHEHGPWQAVVPQVSLQLQVSIERQQNASGFNLETLSLEPNKKCLSAVWRASMPVTKKALKIEDIHVSMVRAG